MEFKIDDKITYTRVKKSGKSIDLTTMYAVIVGFEEEQKDIAIVKHRNGRKNSVHVSRLRKMGDRTELTEIVVGREKAKEELKAQQ
jgi:hypothetical protein